MGMGIGRSAFMATTAIVCVATATPAFAQAKTFDVPAQSATTGIAELGRQADIQIVAARKDTQGKQVNAVRGDMTVEQALAVDRKTHVGTQATNAQLVCRIMLEKQKREREKTKLEDIRKT